MLKISKNGRQQRTTRVQHETYISFLKRFPELHLIKNEDPELVEEKWCQMTKVLNSCIGPKRSVENWKSIIQNWKNQVKSRARNQSGNMQKLTPIEEIAVDLWTKIERDGAEDQRQPDWNQNGSRDAKRKFQNTAERVPKKLKPSMQTYAVVLEDNNPPPRQTRTTRQQHEVYLAFLEANPSFAGHSKKLTEAMNHQWAQLAEELNNLTPQRSVENWKTIFTNWKVQVKSRARKHFETNIPPTQRLTEVELKAVALWKRADSGLEEESSLQGHDQKVDLTEVLWNVSALLDENQTDQSYMESPSMSPQETCCRLCLSTDDVDTFQEIVKTQLYFEDDPIPIIYVLQKYFEIKVQETDLLPTKMCMDCISEINRFYAFKIKCKESESTLKCSLPEGYSINDDNSSPDDKDTEEDAANDNSVVEPSCSGFEYQTSAMDTSENPIELGSSDDSDESDNYDGKFDNDKNYMKKKFCFFCNKMLDTKINIHLELHDALKLVYDAYKFPQCVLCHVMFYSDEELLFHFQQEHEDEPFPEISDQPILSSESTESIFYKCSVCEAYYTDLEVMKNHMLTHFKKFFCPLDDCSNEYSDFVMFCTHLQDKHITECVHCKSSKFNSYSELREHMKQCSVI